MARIDHIHQCEDCKREINTLAPVCIQCRQKRVKAGLCIYCGHPMDPDNPDDVIPSGRNAGRLRGGHVACGERSTERFMADRIPRDDTTPGYRPGFAREQTTETKRGVD